MNAWISPRNTIYRCQFWEHTETLAKHSKYRELAAIHKGWIKIQQNTVNRDKDIYVKCIQKHKERAIIMCEILKISEPRFYVVKDLDEDDKPWYF